MKWNISLTPLLSQKKENRISDLEIIDKIQFVRVWVYSRN